MFFPIDAEKWAYALGQIRRLRHRGCWDRIGSSDSYWNLVFFAALVESVDSMLLEEPRLALELSAQGILLAERIRTEDCPGGTEVGKRSLRAWAHAIRGSACRAAELYDEAEDAFAQATWLATSRAVLPWAAAEVDRRYAALLVYRGSLGQGLALVNRALEAYAEYPVGRAKALLIRAVYYQQLLRDPAQAALDLGLALELIEPKNSPSEARLWVAAVHNLNYVYAMGCSDLTALRVTLRQVHGLAKKLSKNEGYRRALCAWTEALLIAPLGSTRWAKRLLIKARAWLFKHRYYHPGTLCAIDLATLHLRDSEEEDARAVLEDLGLKLAAAKPATATYLEYWLELRLPQNLLKENLAAFRAAIVPLGAQGSGMFQPSTMIIGATSGSSPATD